MNRRIRLAMLGNPDGWYVRELCRTAQAEGNIDISVASFEDLQVEGKADGAVCLMCSDAVQPSSTIELTNSQVSRGFDAILVRTMPLGSLEQVIFRINALHVAESLGITVINPARTLEIAIDKWLTLDYARRIGIEIPHTIVCQNRDDAMIAFEKMNKNAIVKPLFGGEGRGLMKIDDTDMAWRCFSNLQQLKATIYLQQFIPNHGYDLRILLIGQRWYCVARHSNGSDWRTNVSRGGRAVAHQPTEHQLDMAQKIRHAIGANLLGVDILPTLDDRDVLLEVNAIPGWRGTSRALGIDLTQVIVKELVDNQTKR